MGQKMASAGDCKAAASPLDSINVEEFVLNWVQGPI